VNRWAAPSTTRLGEAPLVYKKMTQAKQVSTSDVVLIVSLAYLSVDLLCEWNGFIECHKPLHIWLLVSYTLVLASRLVYMVGSLVSASNSEDFLLNLRHKTAASRLMNRAMWFVIVPFFTAWSVVGSIWLYQVLDRTPRCMPDGLHFWFLGVWQALSYTWILIHCGLGAMAWLMERRLQKAEVDLRSIEDADVLARWGQLSFDGYASLPPDQECRGLSPAAIRSLPGVRTRTAAECQEEEDCPICLLPLQTGDCVRQISACDHAFHRSCIDLWLLRTADCPVCKHKVVATS